MNSKPRLVKPLDERPDTAIVVPGSKSHTNRALLCAALASGTSELAGALDADDSRAMLGAVAALGAEVDFDRSSMTVTVSGIGGTLPPGPLSLDVRQSGVTGRFVLGALSSGSGPYVLDGDAQLRARPFGPMIEALTKLGATIKGDRLPLTITGPIRTGRVSISGSGSSQFLSGLLLAAPLATPAAPVPPRVVAGIDIDIDDGLVSVPYIELTMATMARFGIEVEHDAYRRFSVAPQPYQPQNMMIEPDASAASYFLAAAAITGGRVRVDGLGKQALQGDIRFANVLAQMGATVRQTDDWTEVEGGARLRAVEVNMADISDTAQTLAIVATFADGPTRVTGIGFIRKKETDRVAAVVTELRRLGIEAHEDADGFTIHPGRPRPGIVETYDDHRMAMSFALLGLVHPGIEIANPGCVAKTFPEFFSVLGQLR